MHTLSRSYYVRLCLPSDLEPRIVVSMISSYRPSPIIASLTEGARKLGKDLDALFL